VARRSTFLSEGVSYVVFQMSAALCAGLVGTLFQSASPEKDVFKAVMLKTGYTSSAAVFELVFTCVLAYVYLAVSTAKPPTSQVAKQNFYFGLATASCQTAGTFACWNVVPVALSPAISTSVIAMGVLCTPGTSDARYNVCGYLALATLVELLGGLVAAYVFSFTHPKEKSPDAPIDAAKLVCEFWGTFVLVFTVGCCVMTSGPPAYTALAIGSVLMAMIYATGPVSGGNLNPAVSFALGLSGDMKWFQVIRYWIAQILGGVSAGFLASVLCAPHFAHVAPVEPFSWTYSLLAEVVYTCMLCFVVLNCAASKRNNPASDGNQFFALAIGFVILAGGYAVGGVSGAAFNPAVAIGLDVRHFGWPWSYLWALAELSGGLVAAALYVVVRPDERLGEAAFETYVPKLRTKLVCEFLGVFVLVFTVTMNVSLASPAVALSAAAALMCMIYSLGGVSGGHFNPAVTLAVVTSGRGKCSPQDGCCYVAAQLLGGVVAGGLAALFKTGTDSATQLVLSPGKGYNLMEAGLAEMFFTFVLAYVVLAVATTTPPKFSLTRQNFQFALAIGSCVTAGGFAVGAMSGGELNPAVALGITVNSAPKSLSNFAALGMWELAGGLAASGVFRMTHPTEFAAAAK